MSSDGYRRRSVEAKVTSCGKQSENTVGVSSVKDVMYNVAIKKHLMFSKTTFLPICVGHMSL